MKRKLKLFGVICHTTRESYSMDCRSKEEAFLWLLVTPNDGLCVAINE